MRILPDRLPDAARILISQTKTVPALNPGVGGGVEWGMERVLPLGTILAGRYRLLGPLGRGNMGVVYRAEHMGLGRPVALKVLAPAYGADELAARFEREAHAAARLDHPGCVRVLDHGTTVDRLRYIAMEELEGPTLERTLRDVGPLPIERAIGAAGEILAALDHAHRRGVLHRDVKPANVMLHRRDGAPSLVLIDFGLARLRDGGSSTVRGKVWGSPAYVAPERLRGERCDGRADVYAVGVMLYEMLAGVRPFEGASPAETARLHLVGPPRPLRALRPDVSAALDAVVVRAMAKDPARRWASAAEMRAALDDLAFAAERAADRARRAADASTMVRLELRRPSLARRAWAWLRYGPWRWKGTVLSS